ncbi:MAG: tetratricopeptide repeat protein [Sandaracinaceae bacterium]|nr:tetratricopeptide repeat protein [Sandaracinaceae bacterium]
MLQGTTRPNLVMLSFVCLLAWGRPAAAQPAPSTPPQADAPPAEGADGAVAPPADGTAADVPVDPDEAAITEARRRYAQGSEFYRLARYGEAVAEFSEAYSLWPNPTILYALGQAYEGLSEVNRAIETYQRYLDAAPAGDLRREDAELRIEELRGLLAIVHVAVNVPANVFMDGELLGSAPGDFRLYTGRHTIEVRADGYESQTGTVTIAGGTERTLTFELQATPVAVVVEREPFRFPRPVFYAALGVTGASVVVWGALATTAAVRARDYNDTPGRTNFDRQEARDAASRSNVALGVAGGLAVTTLVIGLLTERHQAGAEDEDEPPPPMVTAAVTPLQGGAMVTARWTR